MDDAALRLSFADGSEPFSGALIHRVYIRASIASPYEATLLVHSTDPAVDPHTVIGLHAELVIAGEPYVDRVPGIVRSVRQLTSVTSAVGHTASYYEVTLVPPHFLASLRFGRRIYQDRDAVGIVQDALAACRVALDPPDVHLARSHSRREYTAQYDETDLGFVFRVLSEEHLTSFFDPRRSGAFVITDDPGSLGEMLPFPVPYRLPSNLTDEGPCAAAVRFDDSVSSGGIDLRDYDAKHPALSRGVPVALKGASTVAGPGAPFRKEAQLSREGYEVGRFADEATGAGIAKRDLSAFRAEARAIECDTNFAVFPGTRFVIEDHARPELAGELLAIGLRLVIDDGEVIPIGGVAIGAGRPRRSYSVRAVQAASAFAPTRVPKPRAVGVESAFVVGALREGHVDVDDDGRVLVEFVWDRRDLRTGAPTRRVRVSQGWAGANRGLVTLPRIGDEVLIAYDGGDPDEPIIVGRVHNAVSRTPLNLPDPDSSVSVWRSRTIGGSGFNQFLMDDKAGSERLEIRAERTRTDLTQGSESSTIGGDFTQSVGGDVKIKVEGSTRVGIHGKLNLSVDADTTCKIGGSLRTTVDGSEARQVRGDIDVTGGSYTLSAGDIVLTTSGGSIHLGKSGVTIQGPKVAIKGGTVTIEGDGGTKIIGAVITLE